MQCTLIKAKHFSHNLFYAIHIHYEIVAAVKGLTRDMTVQTHI